MKYKYFKVAIEYIFTQISGAVDRVIFSSDPDLQQKKEKIKQNFSSM